MFRTVQFLVMCTAISMARKLSVADFRTQIKNKLILAPLTRGGNAAFRRLCSDFGADFVVSEMAYARALFKGGFHQQRRERSLLKSTSEKYFCVQVASKSADEVIQAAELAAQWNATWLDLNCGCPIYEVTRKGLGAAMLRKPDRIEKLVSLATASIDLPLTVKIRLGVSESKINSARVVEGLAKAGAAAVTIHGRTMEQRYSKAADWDMISSIAAEASIPVIGNGDILTHFEALDRLADGRVSSLMAGRGALIKPWIFKEFNEGKSYTPTAEERIEIYFRLTTYFKESFGVDDHGKRHAFYFLPWHFNFFCRYRPMREEHFLDMSRSAPLIQNSRGVDARLRELGLLSAHDELPSSRNKPLDAPLERLLMCESADCHFAIADGLWASATALEAVEALSRLAEERLSEFESSPSMTQSYSSSGYGKEAAVSEWETGGSSRDEVASYEEQQQKQKEGKTTAIPQPNKEVPQTYSAVDLAHFKKKFLSLELRVGRCVHSFRHPSREAHSLFVNTIDMGPSLGTRTVVTGRAVFNASLAGQVIVLLCNVKPRIFMGCKSEGVVLMSYAAKSSSISTETGDRVVEADSQDAIVTGPDTVPLGSLVTLGNWRSAPLRRVLSGNSVMEAWAAVMQKLLVDSEGIVRHQDTLMPLVAIDADMPHDANQYKEDNDSYYLTRACKSSMPGKIF